MRSRVVQARSVAVQAIEERLWRVYIGLKLPPWRVLALYVTPHEYEILLQSLHPRPTSGLVFCGIPLKVKAQ